MPRCVLDLFAAQSEPVELVDEGSAALMQLIEALISEVPAAVGFLSPRPAGAFDASVEFGRFYQEFPDGVRNVGDCPGFSRSLIVSHFAPTRDHRASLRSISLPNLVIAALASRRLSTLSAGMITGWQRFPSRR